MERPKPTNNLFAALEIVGYSVADLLPAFPGSSADDVTEILQDNGWALSRPVMDYGLLGIHPCRSPHFNLSRHGFRLTGPDREQSWPPPEDRPSLFCFGGSTTLGYNVSDRDSIPARLSARLAPRGIEVYNFGSGNYTSRHEFLRFLNLLDQGRAPGYALFLDGFNDSFYALDNSELVQTLDTLYQTEKRRRRLGLAGATWDYARETLRKRRLPIPDIRSYRPNDTDETVRARPDPAAIEAALAISAQDDGPLPPAVAALAQTVWNRYLDSVAMIRAVAARHGVTPLFLWQPVPLFATQRRQRILERLYPLFPTAAFAGSVYRWAAANRFPGMAGDPAFLEASRLAESFDGVCYLDICHYAPPFADHIADAIAGWFLERLHAGRAAPAPAPALATTEAKP
jgi:hypothetical protein